MSTSSNTQIAVKQKDETLDIMKVVTMALVVIGHVANMYKLTSVAPPLLSSTFIVNLSNVIYTFHMPAFFAISGSVFYICIQKGKYSNFGKFTMNKAKRLLVPYVFFALLYVFPCMYIIGAVKGNISSYIVSSYIYSTNSRHLWYLLTLFEIFILFYFISKFSNKKYCKAYILTTACIMYAFSFIVTNLFQVNSCLHYILYFSIGFLYLHTNKQIGSFKTLILSSVLFTIAIVSSYIYGGGVLLRHLMQIIMALLGVVMMYSLSAILHQYKSRFFSSNIFKILKRDGFGIYLFHPMIIYYVFFGLKNVFINPYILFVITLIAAYLISIVLTETVRILHLQVVIGER